MFPCHNSYHHSCHFRTILCRSDGVPLPTAPFRDAHSDRIGRPVLHEPPSERRRVISLSSIIIRTIIRTSIRTYIRTWFFRTKRKHTQKEIAMFLYQHRLDMMRETREKEKTEKWKNTFEPVPSTSAPIQRQNNRRM